MNLGNLLLEQFQQDLLATLGFLKFDDIMKTHKTIISSRSLASDRVVGYSSHSNLEAISISSFFKKSVL